MVSCIFNKDDYRLTFITTLINNWYTVYLKHNHRQDQYNNDTRKLLQTTNLQDIQEGPTDILSPSFTLSTTSCAASLPNTSSTFVSLPITWTQFLNTISETISRNKTSTMVNHDVTPFVFPFRGRTFALIKLHLIIIPCIVVSTLR